MRMRTRALKKHKETPAPTQPPKPKKVKPPPPESFSDKNLTIIEGSGWSVSQVPSGFCDGSAQSRCNRRSDNTCLLSNSNHYRGHLVGTPENGWLTMSLRDVPHGIILARIEFDRKWPGDLMFDYAINGKVTSLNKAQLWSFGKTLVQDLTVYPLLLDKDADPEDEYYENPCDIAIRIRSASTPTFKMRISHIYYA